MLPARSFQFVASLVFLSCSASGGLVLPPRHGVCFRRAASHRYGPLHARKTRNNNDNLGGGGRASIPNLATSLVKSIVGAGALALPAGVATLGDSPKALLPATVLIAVMGAINAYFFSLVGRVCSMTGAAGYREAWDRTVGPESSRWAAAVVALKTLASCLAYSMILADSFRSLAVAAGLEDATRAEALGAVTLLALLPLCLLRDLAALAPFSFLGLGGMAFTTLAMAIRATDGSYADGGVFLPDLPTDLLPSFAEPGIPSLRGTVLLACTLATAFVAHYNAPRFHSELENNTPDRFDAVTSASFAVSAVTFAAIASAGFLTFGASSSGFILNNYSPYDPLIAASRAALASSIVLTYPLPFAGLRDSVMDVLEVPRRDETETAVVAAVSIGLLMAVTVAALLVRDLALVLSVGGGTFSTAVSSVFPTLMFRPAVDGNRADIKDARNDEFDARLALALMWACVTVGVTGAIVALEDAFYHG